MSTKKEQTEEERAAQRLIDWIWKEYDSRFLRSFNVFKGLLEDGWSPGEIVMLGVLIDMVVASSICTGERTEHTILRESQLACLMGCLVKRGVYPRITPQAEDSSKAVIELQDCDPDTLRVMKASVVLLAETLDSKIAQAGLVEGSSDLEIKSISRKDEVLQ